MSKEVLSEFNSLDTDKKQMVEEKYIDASLTDKEWISYLSAVSEYDRGIESIIKFNSRIACVFWLLTLAGIGGVLGMSSYGHLYKYAIVLSVLSVGFIAGIVIFTIKKRRGKKMDIPNTLREFIMPLMIVLNEECDPKSPVHLVIDLRNVTGIKDKEVELKKEKGTYGNNLDENYKNPWLKGECGLFDGSKLNWEIIDNIRFIKITRRKKDKFKTSVKRMINLSLALKQKNYQTVNQNIEGEGKEKIGVKKGSGKDVFKMRRVIPYKFKDKTFQTTTEVDKLLDNCILKLQDFLGLMGMAFQNVKPAKR